MTIGKELLFFFSILGAFNGLILGLYFFFFTRKKYLVNYFLGALLFALSIRTGKSVFLYFDGKLPKIYLQIGLSACFFIGPLLYCFVTTAIKQVHKVPRIWKLGLLFLLALTLVVGIAYPYSAHLRLWQIYFARIIYLQWFAFLFASGIVIGPLLKNIFLPAYKLKPAELWISVIFLANAVIFILYFSALINVPFAPYISGSIAFSLILYLSCCIIFYRNKTDDLFLLNPVRTNAKKLNEDDAKIWLQKLEKVMQDKTPYTNPDLKLGDLSREIQISSHQLSQLLNDELGKNFTTYVNEFRIAEACRMLSTDRRFTLESIGYEVGFNSKSTFFAAFKKIKGVTPAGYQSAQMSPAALKSGIDL